MKKILVFTILSLAILSCKKDKISPAEPQPTNPSYTHVSTTGSYWVYDWYQVDSTGNETWIPAWRDTITIVGDTTINGKIYQHYKGKQWNSPTEYYNRDSSGYVVNPNGVIAYSYVSGPRLLHTHSDGTMKQYNYVGEKQTIVNDIYGSKEASTTYLEVSLEDGTPVNVCGDLSMRFYRYYVSGIGCMGIETEYFALFQGQCSKKRSKLIEYVIAP